MQFAYSSSEGSDGTQSILTDDQVQGNIGLHQLGGGASISIQAAGAANITTTTDGEATGSNTAFNTGAATAANTSNNSQAVTGAVASQNTTTAQEVTGGGGTPTVTGIIDTNATVANHRHGLQVQQVADKLDVQVQQSTTGALNHAHTVSIGDRQGQHKHLIARDHVLHDHEVNIQQHAHTVTIQNSDVNHNHTVQIQNTGGGGTHDNRPRWYSLYYIMKL
jgi:hypothetical protein